MARFPLFGTQTSGRSRRYTSQGHINVYSEVRKDGDRDRLTFYGRPGLDLFANLGETPTRGVHAVGNLLYAVHRGALYSINNAGQITELGTLDTTSGRVDMSNNGKEILIVDGTEGYTWNLDTTTFAKIADADFPLANTCDFQGGFFLVDIDGTGRFAKSASYDGTAWDALEFADAEGFPDDLVRVYVEAGQVVLFGNGSTEVWANVGNADFPYQRVQGTVMEWGLGARWSVADVEGTICFLAKNRTGEVRAMRARGYVPEPIGGDEFAHIINQYSGTSDATGFGYTVDGHSFYQINFPSEGKSWAISMKNGMATEMQSGTQGMRHRGELATEWNGSIIVTDYENGNLYRLNPMSYTDNGAPFAKEIKGRHVFNEEEVSVDEIRIDFEPGVGQASGAGTQPQAMLQVSKNGGHTYGPERWKEIGAQGEYSQRAVWRCLGQAYDWVFKLRVADPVKFVVAGSWMMTG